MDVGDAIRPGQMLHDIARRDRAVRSDVRADVAGRVAAQREDRTVTLASNFDGIFDFTSVI